MGKFIEDTEDIGKLEEILATLVELRGKLELQPGHEGRNSTARNLINPEYVEGCSPASQPLKDSGRPKAEPGPDIFQEIRRARSQWRAV